MSYAPWPLRIFVLAVSICWLLFLAIRDRLRAVLGWSRPRCVALYYHAIRPEDRAGFAWQMEELTRRAHPLPADTLSLPADGRTLYAMVTFDDGFRCVVENAVPELVSRKIPATLFVPAGSLGGDPSWLAGTNYPDAHEPVLGVDDLRTLPRGLIQVGSHSLDHVRLTDLPDDEVRRQMLESRSRLEHITGRPVSLLSAPHGACDKRILRLAREAGYLRVFTVNPALATLQDGHICCGRFRATPQEWRVEFRLKLLGAYSWLPAASAIKHRLLDRPGRRLVS